MIDRNVFILIAIVIFAFGCNESENSSQGKPAITIENKIFDFGEVQRGEMLAHSFIVKNTGKGALIISKVEADCGCTVVDFNREPVQPNDFTNIEVLFNSEGMAGLQIKKLLVYSNVNSEPLELVISAMVKYQLEEGI